jgi:glycosyltransferase involved in cell wall biosynthesis
MRKPSGDSAAERSALIVCPEAPYPATGGGALRTASILEYLAPRYALDVIVFREPGAADPKSAFSPGSVCHLHVIDLPYHSKRPAARAGRNLMRFLRGRPPLNDRFSGFEQEVSRCLGSRHYDVALIEHLWCAPYYDQVAPHAARTILDLHNIESVLYRRSGETGPWPASVLFGRFAGAAREIERRWLPRFSSVLVTSEEDAARVRQIAGSVCVYPNAIPAVARPLVHEENVIIFSGNLDYPPNIQGVRFFKSKIWPVLRERWPELRWRLAGKNAGGVASYLRGDSRIEVIGPVKDAIATIAAARVVVVPLLAGSGTRVKILEAWATGRAVVSTSIGAEGLPARDGEHLVLADTAESFAGAVSRLLESAGERERMGVAGRALYEQRFTWERAWNLLAGLGI